MASVSEELQIVCSDRVEITCAWDRVRLEPDRVAFDVLLRHAGQEPPKATAAIWVGHTSWDTFNAHEADVAAGTVGNVPPEYRYRVDVPTPIKERTIADTLLTGLSPPVSPWDTVPPIVRRTRPPGFIFWGGTALASIGLSTHNEQLWHDGAFLAISSFLIIGYAVVHSLDTEGMDAFMPLIPEKPSLASPVRVVAQEA